MFITSAQFYLFFSVKDQKESRNQNLRSYYLRALQRNRAYRINLMYLCLYVYIKEIYTGCSLANPTMGVYQTTGPRIQQLFSPQGWLSQLLFTLLWNLGVGSNACEGMDLLVRLEKAGKEGKLPSSMSVVPSEGVPQIKGGSFCLERSGLKVVLLGFQLTPDAVMLTTKESHYSQYLQYSKTLFLSPYIVNNASLEYFCIYF